MPAYLLVVALLVCHGVFGALHLFPASSAGSAGEHSSLVGHGGIAHEQDAQHPMAAEYFATLLAAILGMLLLLKGARMRSGVAAFRSSWHRPPPIFHLPRGPSILLLQVFRS